jgi:hypothetical protein
MNYYSSSAFDSDRGSLGKLNKFSDRKGRVIVVESKEAISAAFIQADPTVRNQRAQSSLDQKRRRTCRSMTPLIKRGQSLDNGPKSHLTFLAHYTCPSFDNTVFSDDGI